jgi:hypothetical protein
VKSFSKIKHIKNANLILEQRYLNEDAPSKIPEVLYWMSCDGNKNTLSNESKSFIRDTGEKKSGYKLYYFSETPKDRGEKNSEYDVVGCVGINKCDPSNLQSCTSKFYIDKYNIITASDML